MIVDTMSYTEIREYIFNNKPDDDKIQNFFYKNLRRSCIKLPNGYILNTMYVANINGITYYAVFQKDKKLDFSAAIFATFFYKGSIRVVSLSHDNTLQWFTSHYRERVVERTSNDKYTLKTFFKSIIPFMTEVGNPIYLNCGNTGFVQKGMLHIIDSSIPSIMIYKTIIPLEREDYVNRQLITSKLNELNYRKRYSVV